MPPPTVKPKRRPRRVRERPLGAALGWSLGAVLALGILVFETELHWPGSPLNNIWNLLVVNGQVSPNNPLIGRYIGEINQQDLAFLSFLCLLGGGITLGFLAPRTASQRRVLLAAAAATGGIVVACLALAWTLQLRMQQGHLKAHQIDAQLVGTQLGWALSWIVVYGAGTLLGLRLRDRHSAAAPPTDTVGAGPAAIGRS